jgi:hypothetical protein
MRGLNLKSNTIVGDLRMSKNDENADVVSKKDTVVVQIDNFLIAEAEKALEQYPKSAGEQIEQWAYLGRVAERKLTGLEQLQLMSGEFDVVLVDKGSGAG